MIYEETKSPAAWFGLQRLEKVALAPEDACLMDKTQLFVFQAAGTATRICGRAPQTRL